MPRPVLSGRAHRGAPGLYKILALVRNDNWSRDIEPEPATGRVAVARRLRGNEIAMVFQDPVSTLNPRRTIGDSAGEPPRVRGSRMGG